MIRTLFYRERYVPIFVCDQCGRRIEDAGLALAINDLSMLNTDGDSTNVFHTHKGACTEALEAKLGDAGSATLRRKQARQAARSVLPNATETRIVVTGNYRAWRHFVAMRASEHADVEIRALAIECLRQLQREVPNVFGDFEIAALEDGTEIASSPFVTEG